MVDMCVLIASRYSAHMKDHPTATTRKSAVQAGSMLLLARMRASASKKANSTSSKLRSERRKSFSLRDIAISAAIALCT